MIFALGLSVRGLYRNGCVYMGLVDSTEGIMTRTIDWMVYPLQYDGFENPSFFLLLHPSFVWTGSYVWPDCAQWRALAFLPRLIPLSNRTNFNGCTHPLKFFGLKGICQWTPSEHRWNTDELLSKSYPPGPLLVNREFIGVQRWFAEKKSGLKGFPMNTNENADEV